VILGGLAALFQITGDRAYLAQGESIAAAALSRLTTSSGILAEPCEAPGGSCDGDQVQFKGIFVRYLYDFWLSARTERDASDSRVLNVVLTPAGTAYARAVAEVIHALNREFRRRVDPAQLAAADAVLRAVLVDDDELRAAAAVIRPPR
jgi:predicted alpha-1,6-mannanase (GH76 family)